MYAIVEIAGQQFKVEEGKKIYVHRLEYETDKVHAFDRVLLIEDNERIIIGEPVIRDAVVEGKVLEHVRGDKVIVFKKKRRKGYRVKNGHRQNFTLIEIVSINEKGLQEKEAPKKAVKSKPATDEVAEVTPVPVKEEPKVAAAKKPAGKTLKKEAVDKKPSAKKTAEKKPAEKKSTAKKATAKKTTGEKE